MRGNAMMLGSAHCGGTERGGPRLGGADSGALLSEHVCNPEMHESFAELVNQSLAVNGLPPLRRICPT